MNAVQTIACFSCIVVDNISVCGSKTINSNLTWLYVCFSRIYQVAKLYLFAPSSGLYSCPLAMTDGASKILEVRYSDTYKLLPKIEYIKQMFETSGHF